MSYSFYKVLHSTGLILLILSLGGYLQHAIAGGGKEFAGRRYFAITHGLGMFLLLFAGFGLAARLGLTSGLPGWIYAKLGIWLLLGLVLLPIKRAPHLARVWGTAVLLLAVLAAAFARLKPF